MIKPQLPLQFTIITVKPLSELYEYISTDSLLNIYELVLCIFSHHYIVC